MSGAASRTEVKIPTSRAKSRARNGAPDFVDLRGTIELVSFPGSGVSFGVHLRVGSFCIRFGVGILRLHKRFTSFRACSAQDDKSASWLISKSKSPLLAKPARNGAPECAHQDVMLKGRDPSTPLRMTKSGARTITLKANIPTSRAKGAREMGHPLTTRSSSIREHWAGRIRQRSEKRR